MTLIICQARCEISYFYNGRGTAEQWIKEGNYALNWTRLSCKRFVSNQVRLWLFVLAYILGNFLRRLVLPRKIKHWSLRSLLTRFIKIGAKVVRHSRYVTFQMAEVTINKKIFTEILCRIDRLRYRTVWSGSILRGDKGEVSQSCRLLVRICEFFGKRWYVGFKNTAF